MLTDALLAWVHYVLIIALAAMLVAEVVFYRQMMDPATFSRLRGVDRWYGILAGLVIVSGLSRVFTNPKGAAYFQHNPIFWTKMGLFVLVALLSIPPTIHYLKLATSASPGATVSAGMEYERVRIFLLLQAVLFVFIPLCAALMARGFH